MIRIADEKAETSYVHGCETWSFALGEKYSLSILEKRNLKEIFG